MVIFENKCFYIIIQFENLPFFLCFFHLMLGEVIMSLCSVSMYLKHPIPLHAHNALNTFLAFSCQIIYMPYFPFLRINIFAKLMHNLFFKKTHTSYYEDYGVCHDHIKSALNRGLLLNYSTFKKKYLRFIDKYFNKLFSI